MTEEQAAVMYWEAIHRLEQVLESGHRTKYEIIEDLDLNLDSDDD